jgi:hypothetical protein
MTRTEERVLNDPPFALALAALVDAPPQTAGEYRHRAAGELNRLRLADAVEQFKAGALSTFAVKELLHLQTPQAVHQLRRRGKLLGLPIGNGTWFPAWQFIDGRVRPDLPVILEHVAAFSTDPIAIDRVMRLVRSELDGRSLVEALADPAWAATAWTILAAVGS